jgi:hypothetical protein
MAKKKNPVVGCLLLIFLAIGASIQLFKYNPVAGIAGAIGIVLLGGASLRYASKALWGVWQLSGKEKVFLEY